MKKGILIGQIVQLNMTMFATLLRLLLVLCNIDLHTIKLNIVSSVVFPFSFKLRTQLQTYIWQGKLQIALLSVVMFSVWS
jgi:hypothetical protein